VCVCVPRCVCVCVCVWSSLSAALFGGAFLLPVYLEKDVALSREEGYWLMCASSMLEAAGIVLFFMTGN
jgi:hypothetical protein